MGIEPVRIPMRGEFYGKKRQLIFQIRIGGFSLDEKTGCVGTQKTKINVCTYTIIDLNHNYNDFSQKVE